MSLENSIAFKKYANSNLPKDGQLKTLGTLSQYEKLYQLAHTVPKSSKILDWGCGNGHFSAYLKFLGHEPISFSFDLPEFIDTSSHVLGDKNNPISLPFDDNSFDYIFSIGVLEHVHETGGSQEQSLIELNRVLKPGGTLYVYHLPNRFSWIEALANFLKLFRLHPHYTHTKKFNVKSVLNLFKNWKVLKIERYAVLPRNIWNRLPSKLANCKPLIQVYDLLDQWGAKLLSHFSQNYLVIAEKK